MKKTATTLIAASVIATSLGLALAATPVFADYRLVGLIANCNAPGDNYSDWDVDLMAGKLREIGADYDSIDIFANCYRVRTTDASGNVVDLLFDATTLRLAL